MRALDRSSLFLSLTALAAAAAYGETPHLSGLPTQARWQNEAPGWSATDRSLTLAAPQKTDWFEWPGGDYHADSAPRLLFRADGDFSFSAQVEVTAHRTYDAACLALYGTPALWAKLCLEAQAEGGLSVISVVTRGRSDDVTSFPVRGTSTYLRLAKDHKVLFLYASPDGKAWQIIRKFSLDSPDGFWVGFSAQSPDGSGATARFTDFRYSAGPVNLWKLE
jgi:regulation of enolase protein 1 (concanavalin A-like superfamily)